MDDAHRYIGTLHDLYYALNTMLFKHDFKHDGTFYLLLPPYRTLIRKLDIPW